MPFVTGCTEFSFGFDPDFNLEFSWKYLLGNLFKSAGSLTLKCTRVCYFFKMNSVDFVLHCKFEKGGTFTI